MDTLQADMDERKADSFLYLTPEQIRILSPLIERIYENNGRGHAIVAQVHVINLNNARLTVKYLDAETAARVLAALNA